MAERRGPLVVFALVVLAAALLFWRPFLVREREVIESSPGPPALEPSEVPLGPGSEACIDQITWTARSELARLGVVAAERSRPLEVTASAGGWAARARVEVPPNVETVDIRLVPRPPREAEGRFCIRNAGAEPTALRARGLGRTTARPLLTIDGGEYPSDIVLTLRRAEPESLGGRLGEVVERATVLVPLSPWSAWLLIAALLVAVPGGAFLALRGALAAAAPAGRRELPPARPFPLAGRGRALRSAAAAVPARAAAVPAWAWLALVVAAAGLWLYVWAGRVGTWQNDEEEYVYLARWVANNLPSSLWEMDLLQRGLQRLEIFILALPLGTMKAPGAFLVAHAINVAIYASAAIPAWLMARGLGLAPRWRLLAAVLVLATPWVVYSTSFLTEPPAYGIWAWTLWAVWRACVVPGARSDLLALAFVALAALTRSGFLVLAALLPLAAIAHQLRFGRLAALWRANPLVVVAIAAGLLALAADLAGVVALAELTGRYGTALNLGSAYWDKLAAYGGRLAVGTGFAVFVIGLGWIAARAIRPRDPAAGAFAVTALAATALLLFANVPAGPDERYVFYLATPLAVGMCAALARRDIAPAAVLAAGVFAAWLVWSTAWNPEGGPYGFFIGPAETFYARVGLLRLETYLPGWISVRTAAFLIALAAAALCAYALGRRPRARMVAGVLVGALVVLQLAQAEYTMRRYVNDAGARFGPSLKERAWVDQAIYGEGTAAIVATALGNTGEFESAWREIQFWNTSVDQVALNGLRGIRTPPGDRVYDLRVDPASGLIEGGPLPRHALVPRTFLDLGLAGAAVARPEYLPAELVRLDQPARARYTVAGAQPDGFIADRGEARVHLWTAGLDPGRDPWCLRLPLSVPAYPGQRIAARWTLAFDGERRSGRIAPGAKADVDLELGPVSPARRLEGVLRARGGVTVADGREIALQLGQLYLVECR